MKQFFFAFLLVLIAFPAFASKDKETAYARVMRTGVIRCGYVNFPPNQMIDPETGKLSGISYDLFNRMAKEMDMKVEWVEEIGFGDMVTAMEIGKIDAICTTVGANATRGKFADFTDAPYYVPTGLWVRADDHRFDGDTKLLSSPDIKISSIEGTVFDAFITTHFPKAQIYSLPQISSLSDQMLVVDTGKADATILDNYVGAMYAAQNPGKMKNLMIDGQNFRVDPVAFMILKGQEDFKSMLNIALDEQILTGALDGILKSYDLPPDSIYPRILPYGAR